MEGQGSGTGVTTGAHLCNRFKRVLIVRLELPNRSTIIRRVVGGTNTNGTVLRGFSVTLAHQRVSRHRPRQIVRRGHGGQYQGGSERFFCNVFQNRASKLGP